MTDTDIDRTLDQIEAGTDAPTGAVGDDPEAGTSGAPVAIPPPAPGAQTGLDNAAFALRMVVRRLEAMRAAA